MLEELLVRFCSPTLAGLKTGSLVSCPYRCTADAAGEIRLLNRTLAPKGLRVLPLRRQGGRVLVYLFRPALLERDLSRRDAVRVLRAAGYPCAAPAPCLAELMRRLNGSGGFPHEIGLFLGYPPEDVRGFIENRAGNFKCAGCWKVYGDADAAQRRFAQYRKCTDVYCRYWERGRTLTRLAVPAFAGEKSPAELRLCFPVIARPSGA